MITMRCPRCKSSHIKIPKGLTALQCPTGYAVNAKLVLVTCASCDHRPTMSDATVVEHA